MSEVIDRAIPALGKSSYTDLQLEYPFELDGVFIESLRMRRVKARDQFATKDVSSEEEKEVALFANLCMVSPKVILELDMFDYGRLQGVYSDFLNPKSPSKTSES